MRNLKFAGGLLLVLAACGRDVSGTGQAAAVNVSSAFARGTTPARSGTASDAARFVVENRATFHVRSTAELHPVRVRADDLAMTHVRFEQRERGVRVVGGDVAVHYDREGRVTSVQARYVPDLDALGLTPSVTVEQARSSATSAVAPASKADEPSLVVFAPGKAAAVLAWEVPVRGANVGSWIVTIDAQSGAVLERLDRTETLRGSGVGLDGTRRDVEYVVQGGKNLLADFTQPAGIMTFDAQGPLYGGRPVNVSSKEPLKSWDASAVDAQRLVRTSSDYFRIVFGRNGWDGKGGQMNVYVHVEDQDGKPGSDNAFYDPGSNVLGFGDGRTSFRPLAGYLDVVAHELTHAVTTFESNLRYEGQSGALSESISDIFAAIIEHSISPDDTNNWQIGEGSLRESPIAIRSLRTPEDAAVQQPSHMSRFVATKDDNGGVHANSGIPNQAAYLMAMGGTNDVSKVTVEKGIGWDALAKVWYRTNAEYLTTSSDFVTAAHATVQAAIDLGLSEADQRSIDCAWKAVGVLTGACGEIELVHVPLATPAPTGVSVPLTPNAPEPPPSEPAVMPDLPTEETAEPDATTSNVDAAQSTAGGCTTSRSRPAIGSIALALAAILVVRSRRRR